MSYAVDGLANFVVAADAADVPDDAVTLMRRNRPPSPSPPAPVYVAPWELGAAKPGLAAPPTRTAPPTRFRFFDGVRDLDMT